MSGGKTAATRQRSTARERSVAEEDHPNASTGTIPNVVLSHRGDSGRLACRLHRRCVTQSKPEPGGAVHRAEPVTVAERLPGSQRVAVSKRGR